MRPIISRARQCLLQRRCFTIHTSTLSKLKAESPVDYSHKDSTPNKTRLDPITLHRLQSAQRAYYKRRMVYSTIGVLCGMVGLYLTAIQAPLSPETPTILKSSTLNRLDSRKPDDDPLLILGRERKVVTRKLDDISEERENSVNTGNSVVPEFPRVLKLNNVSSDDSEFTKYYLLGLGTRTVSFLKIQVYVVGVYVAAEDIVKLQNNLIKRVNPQATTLILNEKDELRSMLNNPEQNEQIWDTILKEGGCRMLIRIVPTRNTDFGHLRDAWVRSMKSRAQKAEWNDEKFGENVALFKRIFARGNIPKGTELILSRGSLGNLEVWYHGQSTSRLDKLGEVRDERVSRAVWLGYLAGKGVACEGAREEIVASLLKFVERPFGAGVSQIYA
ncbi:Altered inheritance of mitochondria protein 18, mitochondrial [Erysiphe necator]|nr:Altered inheritance of mitochondria protein 18, mitochondrial [Erysiphe necator]